MEASEFDLSTAEAAILLGAHPKTVKGWVRDGQIRALRSPGGHYRFRRADLDEFTRDHLTIPARGAS